MCKLRYVALHITEKCSHDCPCCYYRRATGSSRRDSEDRDFPLSALQAILDQLGDNDVEEVYLLGGDPAAHPRLFEIARYAYAKALVVTIVSNTHAYLCEPERLAKYLDGFSPSGLADHVAARA